MDGSDHRIKQEKYKQFLNQHHNSEELPSFSIQHSLLIIHFTSAAASFSRVSVSSFSSGAP